jgi:hypothetical protein
MTNHHDTISRATSALAESIASIVPEVDADQAAALAETFDQAEAYLKDNVSNETESAQRFSQMSPKQAERLIASAALGQRARFILKACLCSHVAWRGCPTMRGLFASSVCSSGARIAAARIRSSIPVTATTITLTLCVAC